jgi:hypothetical protein
MAFAKHFATQDVERSNSDIVQSEKLMPEPGSSGYCIARPNWMAFARHFATQERLKSDIVRSEKF